MEAHCPICTTPILRTKEEIYDLAREAANETVVRVVNQVVNGIPFLQIVERRLSKRELYSYLNQKITLRCGHLFHESCIFTWFKFQWQRNLRQRHFSCPLCQQECKLNERIQTFMDSDNGIEFPPPGQLRENVMQTLKDIKEGILGWLVIIIVLGALFFMVKWAVWGSYTFT